MNRNHVLVIFVAVCLGVLMAPAFVLGQGADNQICSVKIDTVNAEKSGFLFWSDWEKVDFKISWQMCVAGTDSVVNTALFKFHVSCATEPFGSGSTKAYDSRDITSGSTVTFENKKAYTQYYFKIDAVKRDSSRVVNSAEPLYSFPAKENDTEDNGESSFTILVNNFKLATSDLVGKIIVGIIIVIFIAAAVFVINSWRTLTSKRFFPTYHELLCVCNTKKRGLDAPKTEVDSGDQCKERGKNIVETIEFIPDFVEDATDKKDPWCNNDWGINIGFLRAYASRDRFYGAFFNRIHLMLTWIGRKLRLFGKYPRRKKEWKIKELNSLILIKTAVSLARKKQYDQIYRTLEEQIESDLEDLRKRSYVDWLWNMGFTEPLLGLFGTVVGLTVAFMKYGTFGAKAIEKFTPQVSIALTTTILGLLTGVTIMLIHYHYNYKLDRIGATWYKLAKELSKNLTPEAEIRIKATYTVAPISKPGQRLEAGSKPENKVEAESDAT